MTKVDYRDQVIEEQRKAIAGLNTEADRLARQHNVAVERMRIAEYRESELQGDVDRLRAAEAECRNSRGFVAAENERLRREIATWGQMWDDAYLLEARVEALRNGTAILGSAKAS